MAHITKEYILKQLRGYFKNSSGFIITNFSKLDVVAMDSLRRKLEKNSSRFLVTKNSLFKIALSELKMDQAVPFLEGTTGIAIYKDDPVAAAKTLFEFSRSNENLKIRGAIVNGQILDAEKIKEFSNLPGKEVMRVNVVMRIKSPLTGLVNVLAGPMRSLVTVLNQISKKKA